MSRRVLYGLALLVLVADQLAKAAVVRAHPAWADGDRELIPGFFALTFSVNTGGAFGILPHGTLLLALAAAVAAVSIVIYTLRAPMPLPRMLGFALALPLGGALGNLLDRIRLGHVIDFLSIYAGSDPERRWQFPIFNLADTAICIGVGLLALYHGRQPAPDTVVLKEEA